MNPPAIRNITLPPYFDKVQCFAKETGCDPWFSSYSHTDNAVALGVSLAWSYIDKLGVF
jgi:hypothetical protein